MYYCKWNIYFWLVLAILALLSSCEPENETIPSVYYDTDSFIQEEISYLAEQVSHLNKHLVLNGVAERVDSIKVDSTSFKELASLFKQANINKVIYQDEYQTDTFWILDPVTQENIEVVNYTTNKPKLKVKWLQVYSNGSLKASLQGHNFLFSYEKEVYYQKLSRFSVISWQKTIGQDTIHVHNEVDYL